MSAAKPPKDMDLFREVMGDTKPLSGKSRVSSPAPKPAVEKMSMDDVVIPPNRQVVEPVKELKAGKNQSVDGSTFEKFRRGQMEIDATLDLHGLTQIEAHKALQKFIGPAYNAGDRCVLVITGKGGVRREDSMEKTGVLRENLPKWLNSAELRPKILAFAPAQPKHGGSGAFYVLLKRRRD